MIDNSANADLFLRRLTGGIAAGLGLLLVGYALYLLNVRIPAIEEMVIDFDTTIPAATRWIFRAPAMPLVMALATLVVGVAAAFAPKRGTLVAAWIGVFVSLASAIGVELALALPLIQSYRQRLRQSVAGPPVGSCAAEESRNIG